MKKTDAIRGSDGQCAEQGMDVTRIGLADSCPPFQDDASHSALVIQNGQLSGDPCGSHPSVNLRNVRWQLNVHFGHKEVLLLFDSDGGDGSSFDAVSTGWPGSYPACFYSLAGTIRSGCSHRLRCV